MTDQNMKDVLYLKEEAKREGRMEGATMVLFFGLLYLIGIAVILN